MENLIVSSEVVDSKHVLCKAPQPYEIMGTVQASEQPPLVRSANFSPIVEKLADLPVGEGLELATNLSQAELSSLRGSAIRRGFNISFRRMDGGWRIFKLPLSSSRIRKGSPDTQEAYARFMQGETLESLARERGMSRQGLSDRFVRHESFNKLSSKARAIATDEFLAPYLAALEDVRCCFVCGDECRDRRHLGLCLACRSSIRIRARIASRLRSYKLNGERQNARQAAYEINKFGVKPEDLRRA